MPPDAGLRLSSPFMYGWVAHSDVAPSGAVNAIRLVPKIFGNSDDGGHGHYSPSSERILPEAGELS
jgi:hypothetical protein